MRLDDLEVCNSPSEIYPPRSNQVAHYESYFICKNNYARIGSYGVISKICVKETMYYATLTSEIFLLLVCSYRDVNVIHELLTHPLKQ